MENTIQDKVAGSASLFLVKDGRANGVIVNQNSGEVGKEVKEFQGHLLRATGVQLPMINTEDRHNLPEDRVRVLIGTGSVTDELGITFDDHDKEVYRVAVKGNQLILAGSDSKTTLWAVYDFLDRHMGVRWLWPGDVGTHVPKTDTLALPAVDKVGAPTLKYRNLLMPNIAPQEGLEWADRHMLSLKSDYPIKQHAFADWYDKYYATHPEYFASPPKGVEQQPPRHTKLCLSNKAIDDIIIKEWKEAGKPNLWFGSPNDSVGYCICEDCMAMDYPLNQDAMDVWWGRANLTERHVQFWNRLVKKMRALNPQIMLQSLAYGAYSDPPVTGTKLEEGIFLALVPKHYAYDQWQGWLDAGASGLIMRPNWWHTGALAPLLPLHKQGNYFKFAQERGMIGYFFDLLFGSWGTQGLNYYMIARLSQRPEMSVDDVIDEYSSAFGQAAPVIKNYFSYWEKHSDEVGYRKSTGEKIAQNEQEGLFHQLQKEHGFSSMFARGSWYIMPYLYTDEVLSKARAILDQAELLVIHDEKYVHQRIEFLRDGLKYLEITREVIRYGAEESRPAGATLDDFRELVRQRHELRDDLSTRHVIWGDFLSLNEEKRKLPTTVNTTQGWEKEGINGFNLAEFERTLEGTE